jgi:hypothetical protein
LPVHTINCIQTLKAIEHEIKSGGLTEDELAPIIGAVRGLRPNPALDDAIAFRAFASA